MISSINDVNMYLSIKLTKIKKAVIYFTKLLIAATKKTTNLCLELIRFGFSSTLIYFDGDYYECHWGEKMEEGLEIVWYESYLLVNLVDYDQFEKS